MTKTIEFKNIQELIKSKIWEDKNVESTKTHFDKNNKKFITKVEYEK